jgi:hypothetical protein
MLKDYHPSFLRGIGTTVVLLGVLVGLATARRHVDAQAAKARELRASLSQPSRRPPEIQALETEIEELKSEMADESFAVEVLDNPSFEWMGFLGTAIVASSFFAEAYLRKTGR